MSGIYMQVQDIYKTRRHQRDRHVCKNDSGNINNNKEKTVDNLHGNYK